MHRPVVQVTMNDAPPSTYISHFTRINGCHILYPTISFMFTPIQINQWCTFQFCIKNGIQTLCQSAHLKGLMFVFTLVLNQCALVCRCHRNDHITYVITELSHILIVFFFNKNLN